MLMIRTLMVILIIHLHAYHLSPFPSFCQVMIVIVQVTHFVAWFALDTRRHIHHIFIYPLNCCQIRLIAPSIHQQLKEIHFCIKQASRTSRWLHMLLRPQEIWGEIFFIHFLGEIKTFFGGNKNLLSATIDIINETLIWLLHKLIFFDKRSHALMY